MLTIRLVDPGDDHTVRAFLACQDRTYAEFGTEKAARRVSRDEIEDGNVFFVVAQDERSGELVGGLNFCLRRAGMQLPIEVLLAENPLMQNFHAARAELARWSTRGLTESSGLWADSSWRGTGLSVAMFRVLIAAMPSFGVRRSVAFTHQHVLNTWSQLGWREDAEVRRIPYPDARYESSIIWLDPVTLDGASEKQRDHILHLRDVLKRGGTVRWPVKDRQRSRLIEARS